MTDVNTGLAPSVYAEFVNVVEQLSPDTLREQPKVAGLLPIGLSLAAEGIGGPVEELGSTTKGP